MDTTRLDRIGKRRFWVVGVVAVLLAGLGGYWIAGQEFDRAAEEERAEKAEKTADQLCDQIESMGRTCVARPSIQPEKGDPGRGIAGVVAQGCSIRIRYTDATTETVGPFCGADGSPGPRGSDGPRGSLGPRGSPGADGVSITNATTDGCDVVISFSNGETRRVGPFCGPPGEDGEDGRPGRSLIDMDCEGQGRTSDWHLTWREPDGSITEETVDGPCRVSEPGDPSPRPPPIDD